MPGCLCEPASLPSTAPPSTGSHGPALHRPAWPRLQRLRTYPSLALDFKDLAAGQRRDPKAAPVLQLCDLGADFLLVCCMRVHAPHANGKARGPSAHGTLNVRAPQAGAY